MNLLVLILILAVLSAALMRRPPRHPVFSCCLPASGATLPPAEDSRTR